MKKWEIKLEKFPLREILPHISLIYTYPFFVGIDLANVIKTRLNSRKICFWVWLTYLNLETKFFWLNQQLC